MRFNPDKLGMWSSELDFPVELDHVLAYARATNDNLEPHVDGVLAPPNFAVAVLPRLPEVLDPADAAVDPDPGELARLLHGEQDLTVHRPIRPGMKLRVKAATTGVHGKASGTTVVSRLETTDETGAPVNTQVMTMFYRGVAFEGSRGEQAPDHTLSEATRRTGPITIVTQRFDDNQTFRYAEASGDYMAVHLDDEAARAAGLPGIIVHGLCTMAFVSHAAIGLLADGEPQRLRRMALRFSRVARPGEQIATSFWHAGTHGTSRAYAFETLNPAGEAVLTNGLVEVAP